MSKKQDFSHVDDVLKARIAAVLNEAASHTYSVSRVFGVYNDLFKKTETPQSCSSCLRSRVELIRKWADTNVVKDPITPVIPFEPATPNYTDPENPGYVQQAPGSVRYPMAEGLPIDFMPKDGDIYVGSAIYADGTAIAEGVYTTAGGQTLMVAEDGSAAFHVEFDEVDEAEVQAGATKIAGVKIGVIRIPMAVGMPVDMTPASPDNDKVGPVVYADGSKVKAGTYATAAGAQLVVRSTGVATLKIEADTTKAEDLL